MRERLRLAAAKVCVLMLPAAILGQAEITALATDSDPLETTDELRLSRFADFSEETTVAVGTLLEVGDLLSSASQAIDVELSCGAETLLRFSGGFRLLIDDPAETDCAVDLLSGTVDAQTETPVEVGAGNVTLGVEGTQFSLSLIRTEEGADRDLAVFEGKVRVRGDSIDQEVETGRSWRFAEGEQVWGEVSQLRAERTAALNARLEVAKGLAAGEQIADKQRSLAELRTLHLEVLTKPTDKDSRVELAKTQLQYKQDNAAAYHLKRADVTTEEELEENQIDKRVMPFLSKSQISAPTRDVGALRVTTPVSATTVRAESDPFELIEQGDYDAAIELLKERAAEQPTSKVYYGLARAYVGREGPGSELAKAYAGRALGLYSSDRELSRSEYLSCRRIRAGARP